MRVAGHLLIGDDETALLADAMVAARLPETHGGVWVTSEAAAVPRIRRHFQVERGLDRRRIKAS
jgi:NADPH-dependent ferric siderophore reductase